MGQAHSGQRLAKLLGAFSLGLGTVQAAAPAAVNRLVGVRATSTSDAVMRAVGVQELSMGAGILTRPRSAGLLWSRVAGDMMHLGVLAAAARQRRNDPRRAAAAAGAVAGVMLLDIVAARRLARGSRTRRNLVHARSSVTVNRPVAETYDFWRDLENLPRFMNHLESVQGLDRTRSHWVVRAPGGRRVEWDAEIVEDRPGELLSWRSEKGADVANRGTVRFRQAPGGLGTEVDVGMEYRIPGGRFSVAIAALFGEEPRQQLKDTLRRFKQVMETGEVARSEGTPEGTQTQRQRRQRVAQPVG